MACKKESVLRNALAELVFIALLACAFQPGASAPANSTATFAPPPLNRKAWLIGGHPMYGRPLSCRELDDLWAEAAAAKSLPSMMSIAYLVQGEGEVDEKEAVMWSDHADMFRLTYRAQRPDAIFCPDLIMSVSDQRAYTQGRNALLLAARLQELRRGQAYEYYVFSDSDVVVYPSWAQALPQFEAFLEHWQPAIGVPLFYHERSASKGAFLYTHLFSRERGVSHARPRSIAWHDQLFVAYHRQAAELLLPLASHLDVVDHMISQWKAVTLANVLFRGHVLLFQGMEVRNPEHGRPKDVAIQPQCENVSRDIRSRVPQRLRRCVLDVWNTFYLDIQHEGFRAEHVQKYATRDFRLKHRGNEFATRVGGSSPDAGRGYIFLHSYFPWGIAKRKDQDYTNARFATAAGCDDEPVSREFNWAAPCWTGGRSLDEWLTCARHFKLGSDPTR